MTRISPNSHFSSSPSNQGQNTAPSASGATPGMQRPIGERQAAPAGAATGKRPRGTEDFLMSASRRPRIENSEAYTKGNVKTRRVNLAIKQSVMTRYASTIDSLIKGICQKPAANGGAAAGREAEVKELVGKWDQTAHHIPHINSNGAREQRKLILTRLLAKIIRNEDDTFEKACGRLRTLCALTSNPVAHLNEKAQEYCVVLKEKNPTLPKLPALPWDCMALIALHEDLESKGYELPGLVRIASKDYNSSALLLLDSDIMNQPPFTSGSGLDTLSEPDRAALIRDRKVKALNLRASGPTMVALVAHYTALQALGFSPEDTLPIANYRGGDKTIEAILKHYGALTSAGFSHTQIVKVVTSVGYAPTNIKRALALAGVLLKSEKALIWIVDWVCDRPTESQFAALMQRLAKPLHSNVEQQTETGEPTPHTERGAEEEQWERDFDTLFRDGASIPDNWGLLAADTDSVPVPYSIAGAGGSEGGGPGMVDVLLAENSDSDPEFDFVPYALAGAGANPTQVARDLRELREDGVL